MSDDPASPHPINTDPIDLDELLHPDERSRFLSLCIETSSADLAELSSVVELHLEQVKDLADHRTDVDTAEKIAAALNALLADVSGYAADQRALVRGAVEYFLLTDDADGDIEDVLGFDDDARVVNSVLEALNRGDLRITFE